MKSSPTSSSQNNNLLLFTALGALLIVSVILSICVGSVSVSLNEIFSFFTGGSTGAAHDAIIRYSRLPRTAGCLFAGMALAVSGAVIQSVLANPLAAPNIIGVNSGAGMMVALWSIFFPNLIVFTPVAAFLGAFLSVMIVLMIAKKSGASKITLVLAGVAVSGIFAAGIDAAISFSPDALTAYSDFKIGGLANVSFERILPAAIIILSSFIIILSLCNELDVMMLGSDTARSLGLNVRFIRPLFLALAAALAGAAVSFAGLLGFIGLIVPHIMRRLFGEQSRILVVSSAIGGAVMLLLCDLIARVLFAPYELSVGIVLSFLGGPFFIWLLLRQRGGRNRD